MKIILEEATNPELEVVIRGNLRDPQLPRLMEALQRCGGMSKLFLYAEEREYIHRAEEIDYFEADGDRVYAHLGSKVLEVRHKLYALAEGLYGKGFVQISKGVVVNTAQVASVAAEFSGNYVVHLKNQTRLSLSRKYVKQFRQYILEVAR